MWPGLQAEHTQAALSQSPGGGGPCCCDPCGKGFRYKSVLSHPGVPVGRKRTSEACGQVHQRAHLVRSRGNVVSGQGFRSARGYRWGRSPQVQGVWPGHQRVLLGEKPPSCGQCGTGFGCSCTAVAVRTHTPKRPSRCDGCGRGWSHHLFLQSISALTRQCLCESHSEPKAPPTPDCTRRDTLQMPLQEGPGLQRSVSSRSTPARTLTCSDCGKGFWRD